MVLIVSTYLFNKAAGSLSLLKPNIVSITYYYSFIVTCFIGSLLIVLGIDHYMLERMRFPDLRETGFYYLSAVMILFPLTMVLFSRLFGFNTKTEYNQYLDMTPKVVQSKVEFYYIFVSLSVISILSIGYTMAKLDQIPLLELFKGSNNLAQLRIDATRGFSGNFLIRNIFAINLTVLLSLIAYIYMLLTKELKWKLWFFVLFSCGVLMNIYNLAKAPVLFYLLMFILATLYIGKLKLTLNKLLILAGAGVVAIVFMYIFIMGAGENPIEQFVSINSGPIGRIILAQVAPFYLHLDLFGTTTEFLNGKSLPSSILNLYQIEQVRSARLVMEEYFPNRIQAGTGGVLNTIYLAEAYANYGVMGIYLGTLHVAIFVQAMFMFFIRLPKNPVFISLFVFFTINIPRVIVGGYADFIFNPLWTALLILLLGGLLFSRFLKDFIAYIRKARIHYK